MERVEIIEAIRSGHETSTIQFKVTLNNINQLVQELVAFSNSLGGVLIIGVSDKGEIQGLSQDDIRKFNQWIGSAATDLINAPISPLTQVVNIDGKNVLTVEVPKGTNIPYYTQEGIAYIKKGSDKRIAQPEEILRMFQESNKIYADEIQVNNTSMNDVDVDLFKKFVEEKTNTKFESIGQSISKIMNNMGLAQNDNLTLAGLLLFGKNPQKFRPVFSVQCVSFVGNDLAGKEFRDSEPPFEGNLSVLYEKTLGFINRNLRKVQVGESFNSLGELEIPKETFEELIVNALIHRDYFINSSIKVFIFDNRIEVISPGKLPNTLSIEKIKSGTSIARNPILFSNARYLLPYIGIGSGIPRVFSVFPGLELINDKEKELFIAVIKRPIKS
jgi:ATP-dependent DNA helicase RecG